MIQTQMKKKAGVAAKLEKLFHEADTTGDGNVSWDEFHELLSNDKVWTHKYIIYMYIYRERDIHT